MKTLIHACKIYFTNNISQYLSTDGDNLYPHTIYYKGAQYL